VEVVELSSVTELHFFFLGPPLLVPGPEPDFFAACASTEPAAAFAAWLVRPSRSTLDAVLAAFLELVLPGSTWDRALPPTVLDDLPVAVLRRTVDAFFATTALVLLVGFVAMVSLG
jgi:hypothetical protein